MSILYLGLQTVLGAGQALIKLSTTTKLIVAIDCCNAQKIITLLPSLTYNYLPLHFPKEGYKEAGCHFSGVAGGEDKWGGSDSNK